MDNSTMHQAGSALPASAVPAVMPPRSAMARLFFLPLLLCLSLALCGCAAVKESSLARTLGFGDEAPAPALLNAEAALQEEALGAGGQGKSDANKEGSLPYKVVFEIGEAADPPPAEKKNPPEFDALLKALKDASLLEKLASRPPRDVMGLQLRVDKDVAEAKRLLHAFGYYAGKVMAGIEQDHANNSPPAQEEGPARQKDKALVHLSLAPGPLYSIGQTVIYYRSAEDAEGTALLAADAELRAPPSPPSRSSRAALPLALPASLEEAGLKPEGPALSSEVLSAVEGLPLLLGRRGYPLAEVLATRYVVDHERRELMASVLVNPGPKAAMGKVILRGDSAVSPDYVFGLAPWRQGRLWDSERVERYTDILTRQGLFRSIQVKPVLAVPASAFSPDVAAGSVTAGTTVAPRATTAVAALAVSATNTAVMPAYAMTKSGEDSFVPPSILGELSPSAASGAVGNSGLPVLPVYDLEITVADAPHRTLGGGLTYESDRGLGVEGYWEHRNFFGSAERLRLETTIWQDTQYARALFRKPGFLHLSQDLTAEGWLRNESTVAYEQRALWLSGGIERRLPYRLTLGFGLGAEGGDLKDALHKRQGYSMFSLPMSLRYDSTRSVLDAVRGQRAGISVKPAFGFYSSEFTIAPTRLDLATFHTLWSGKDDQNLVLALRAATGTIWHEDAQKVPASSRYYAGGGGSVRGYAYQSLGPRARNGDSLGGASFAEVGAELRWRLWKDLSVVPFVDGGNVYTSATPDVFKHGMYFGAGLGFRYHTPVGPLRLDVATPINARSGDAPVFIYMSIGQSF